MQSDHSSIHNTEINRIQNAEEGGWEFICHSCGYHARYTINHHGVQKLEILFAGDSNARHTTGIPPEDTLETQGFPGEFRAGEDGITASMDSLPTPPDDAGMNLEDLAEEEWLPPQIQEQVEAILRKYE